MKWPVKASLALVACLIVGACDDDPGDPPVVQLPTRDISWGVEPPGVLPGEPQDWADSLPLPAWVLDPGRTATRRYSAPGTITRQAGPRSPFMPNEAPVIALRRQGRMVSTVGIEELTEDGGWSPATGTLSELGHCRSTLSNLEGSRGTIEGRVGSWHGRLFASQANCERWERALPIVTLGTADESREFTTLLAESGVGTSIHHPAVLEHATIEFNGGRFTWGVVRSRPPSRMIPPSPRAQVAFVLRRGPEGSHEVLWHSIEESPDRVLSLAGVFDLTGDRIPEAIFVHSEPSQWTLRVVGASQEGFGLLRSHIVER